MLYLHRYIHYIASQEFRIKFYLIKKKYLQLMSFSPLQILSKKNKNILLFAKGLRWPVTNNLKSDKIID